MGLIRISDAETNQEKWIDTGSKATREAFAANYNTRMKELDNAFTKSGVDHVAIPCDEDFVKPLMTLFKNRA